jgi:hypothetical protein
VGNATTGFNIESSGVVRTNYTSAGTITNTLPANQNYIIDASASAAVSNTLLVGKGPINATQSTIFYAGQDAAGSPVLTIGADNTSVWMGASANKPLHLYSNGTYRGRVEAASSQWVFGGSAANAAATNATVTAYTPNTSNAPAFVARPFEAADVAVYHRFETPAGTLRGMLEYNSGLYLTASGGANVAMQGTTASMYTASGANKLELTANGQVQYTSLASDPGSLLPAQLWYNNTEGRFRYRDGSATSTVTSIEKDLKGAAIVTTTSNSYVVIGDDLNLKINATSGNASGTCGASMREGVTYWIKAINNSTNTSSILADTANGYTLDVDGVNGTSSSYTMGLYEMVLAKRVGTTILIKTN